MPVETAWSEYYLDEMDAAWLYRALARVESDPQRRGIFDNLGKTRAESNIDEATHTVDVTLFFSGAGTPTKGKDGKRQ